MILKTFKRTIGDKEILAFDVYNPETYTGNDLVDSVLSALHVVERVEAKLAAELMGLPERKLSCAMEILTGLTLAGVAELVRIKKLRDTILKHKNRPMDEIAEIASLYDRSSAWRLMNNKKFAHYFADIDMDALRPKRYYKSKKGEKKRRR